MAELRGREAAARALPEKKPSRGSAALPHAALPGSPVRVLLVENTVRGLGGSYESLFLTATHLDRKRFEPVVLFFQPNHFAQRLEAQGIQTGIYYPIPAHLQEAHRDLGYRAGDFPVAEHVSTGELSLPIYPELSNEAIERIAAAVAAFPG